ncbi:MAG TPA: PIN domain-containing protein [Pyrinomonadaceae bacterium]|nr:PIN domain-containing protein [Pyrinomonadaceae bacterium]
MNLVFADTQFFVGIINPHDQWHEQALLAEGNLVAPRYVTSESVLTEVLTFFCEYGPELRLRSAAAVEMILGDPNTEVVSITSQIFNDGLRLYKERPDKGYSLTDCISMNISRERGITDVLSGDPHFRQEGFILLM